MAPLLAVLVAIIVERTMIRPLYGRDPVYSLLLTFGLSLIAEEAFQLIWGANDVPVLAAACARAERSRSAS